MIQKIGFSASRCIRDIVEDKVKLHQVVLITTGTDCPELDIWLKVMDAYASLPVWDDRSLAGLDMVKVKDVATELWETGRVHQVRTNGGHRRRSPYAWMDLVHTKEDRDANPVLADAWSKAQMVEALVAPQLSDYDAYERDMNDIIDKLATDVAEETSDHNEDQPSK